MSSSDTELTGPDFSAGIARDALVDGGLLLGHADGEAVVLTRRGCEIFAIGAICTHYSGPLAEGRIVGDTLRCPWHHAAFCLRTGEAVRAPALDPVPCWRVEERDGKVFVRERLQPPAAATRSDAEVPRRIVIVGGGAAGLAAAEMLRRKGYRGRLTLFSADDSPPCDRTNLSKSYLAGNAPEEWVALRSDGFYREHDIDLRLDTVVARIHAESHEVELGDGERHAYDRLLLATGARPVRLEIPGAELPHVYYLRTWTDSRKLIEAARSGKRAVIIGSSFIGLEVASSLRTRGVEVDVVGRDQVLMERILGAEVGNTIRKVHESHGVRFHLGTSPVSIRADSVELANGESLPADFVVIGVGVRPALELAEQAGLTLDRGVQVNDRLQTSAPDIYAAGDIARWPDPLSGEALRVEHWVVAQRQGQVAACNMLGEDEALDLVPFFWTEQFDFSLAYVGHAEGFDTVEIDGDMDARDCEVRYLRDGKQLAAAFIGRDLAGLGTEVEFEAAFARKEGARS